MTPVEPSTLTIPMPMLISAVVALAGAVVALAGAVGYLFRHYSKRVSIVEASRTKEREGRAEEREAWVAERARYDKLHAELRAEYEAKYHATLRTLYEDAREHENTSRREYTENVEVVAKHAAEASDQVTQVIDKIYARLIEPRRPPH